MRYTKKEHEAWLNEIYSPDEALEIGLYLSRATRLLSKGKYGTAVRKYDPIAFNVSYRERDNRRGTSLERYSF